MRRLTAAGAGTDDPPRARSLVRLLRPSPLFAIVALYVALASIWNVVTPPFETPDEDAHLRYVRFLATTGRLPDPRVDGARAGNESFQPPLYYGIAALTLRLIDAPLLTALPDRVAGWDWDTVPKNFFVPSSADPRPLQLLRELSVLFGIVTVCCTYLAATLLGAFGVVRAAATIATAALPQFTFMAAAVNPNSLAVALAAVGLVLLLRILRSPLPSRAALATFGATTGVAVLAEYHTVYLLALAGLAYPFAHSRSTRRIIQDGAMAGASFLAVAGWWFLLNAIRFGDPSGLSVQRLLVPELLVTRSLWDPYFIFFFPTITYQSFFGVFGWLNTYLPQLVYVVFGALWLGALGGICRAMLVRRSWDPTRRALVLAPLLLLVLILYANLFVSTPQGRYFFPAIPAISCLFALGLAELPGRIGRLVLVVAPAFFIVANLYSLWLVWTAFARA